jgi:uncharacterized protein YciI
LTPHATHPTLADVAEWIYFIHPPRDDFAATMTDAEKAVWGAHAARLARLLAEGTLILAGPTLGTVNTGVAVFEAEDERAARAIVDGDPIAASGFARLELRPFHASFLRGRADS